MKKLILAAKLSTDMRSKHILEIAVEAPKRRRIPAFLEVGDGREADGPGEPIRRRAGLDFHPDRHLERQPFRGKRHSAGREQTTTAVTPARKKMANSFMGTNKVASRREIKKAESAEMWWPLRWVG